VAQLRPHPEVVVPAQDLAHQNKAGLQRLGEGPQALQIAGGEAVGHIQPQPVDPELLHPAPDGLELVLHHIRVVKVQLDQLAVALPVLIPEAVTPVGVAVEVQIEPVPVGAVPLLLLYVPKGPEAPAHMVEHSVQQDPEPGVVKGAAHLGQVFVGPQAGVQPVVVPGVVAVAVAVKHRIEQDGVRPQPFDVLHPVQQPQDAVLGMPVVVRRRAAQAQGIDLIEDSLVKPHIGHSFRLPAGSLRRRGALIAGRGKKTGRAPPGPPCETAAETPPPGMPCDIPTLYSFSLKNQEKGGGIGGVTAWSDRGGPGQPARSPAAGCG